MTPALERPNDRVAPLLSVARCHAELAVLTALVFVCYFARLTSLPVCGEESRWASAAREMIVTGDWVVPRQQGDAFPERPPLGSWGMAAVGIVRGQVDLVAVRLPSSLAILLITWLVYAYALAWTSRLAAFASAVAFATSGQTLMLGRFGESEAVFTLFTAGSLLVWHFAYIRGWHPGLLWSAGYSLAALGALAKGLQAPIYFVAVTGVYLSMQRNWRLLLSVWHAVGLVCFAFIVGLWLVPFAQSEWTAVDDIWAGLAQDRFTTHGLLKHLITYPFETVGCLLPWSPLLGTFVIPGAWKRVYQERPHALFLLTALAVTYPTVWTAALARGRYYMPLYPLVAVLIGLAIESAAQAEAASYIARYWRRFLRTLAAVAIVGAAVLLAASTGWIARLAELRQGLPFALAWLLFSSAVATYLFISSRARSRARPQWSVAAVGLFVGVSYVGVFINVRQRGANDLVPAVADIKQILEHPTQLVSLGRVYHRFAYSYDEPIRQIPWPTSPDELPAEVTYFCYDWHPHYDTEELRNAGDSRQAATTSGKLPFAWEKVAEIPCDPVKRDKAHRSVVIGRVRRGPVAAHSPTQAARDSADVLPEPILVADPAISRPVRR